MNLLKQNIIHIINILIFTVLLLTKILFLLVLLRILRTSNKPVFRIYICKYVIVFNIYTNIFCTRARRCIKPN